MEKIFLKNYKGFKEQLLNLTNVNFLVGENSTGKTSLLKIIGLLSSREFWFDSEFSNSDLELGYFEEILNKSSAENFFQIGIEKKIDSPTYPSFGRILLEWKEENSLPKIYRVKTTFLGYDIYITITKKQIRYKYKPQSKAAFNEWVKDFDFPVKYSIMEIPFQMPLFLTLTFVEEQIADLLDTKKTIPHNPTDRALYPNYKWLAPVRAKPKRIYESFKTKYSPEGNHIPTLLKNLLHKKKAKNRAKLIDILKRFGQDSKLFDTIETKELGNKESSPFEIIVKYNDIEVKLPNAGYGVSQILPILIEILSSSNTTFAIQQPEVHLHPRAQSAFGSFIYKAAVNDDNKFIIETHSDYTINRFRHGLSNIKTHKNKPNAKVLFFERVGNNNILSEIDIKENGEYSKNLPQRYRDFFIDEELRTLSI